ncbi:MAG TPA: energy-coupling factor ABC transporter permease [Candidatus Udaeobacter sp.]|jgi:cobalt/nickel transport system permease protein|nr:energy-coupling factor ABC transporter permease [Candidatus Udaeobacter sp.]
MSHLHIPDGVLPPLLWAGGLLLALILLVLSGRGEGTASELPRGGPAQSIATRGALGGVVLAAMALELPLGPIEYHLSLVGPVGVLIGPAAAFQLVFVVSAILALAGHGGFTVVGLNALVLGAGAAVARPLYRRLIPRLKPAPALALSTAVSQGLSGVLWMLVMVIALRSLSHGGADPRVVGMPRMAVLTALALPLWILGIAVESAVAFGLARFLARVRPDLLPAPVHPGPV